MSELLRTFLENERGIKRFLARFLRRPQDIDDLTQETFLRAFAAQALCDVRDPRAFLYRVARNLALNEKARFANKLTDSLEDAPDLHGLVDGEEITQEEALHCLQKMAVLTEAISTLPPQCRRVFLLRTASSLSQAEIAQRLGISISTVEKHVTTGLQRCREFLARRGYGELRVPADGRLLYSRLVGSVHASKAQA